MLDGSEPAGEVIHDEDNNWLVGDGVTDPDLPRAAVASHIWPVIERNSSVADLTTLPLGHIATGQGQANLGRSAAHEYQPED